MLVNLDSIGSSVLIETLDQREREREGEREREREREREGERKGRREREREVNMSNCAEDAST